MFYNWRYWRPASLPVDAALLTEAAAAWDDAQESGSVADTCPSSAGWERWQRGWSTSVHGERCDPTAAPPAGGQGSGGGGDAAPAAVTCRGAGVTADGAAGASCARSQETSAAPPEPTVGITFVGSFY